MQDTSGWVRVCASPLRRLCTDVFVCMGLAAQDAACVADSLVDTDVRGVYTHGVVRVPTLVARLEKGANNPRPKIAVVKSQGATALIDGDNGMGQVISRLAMEMAIDKAKQHGISGVGAYHSNFSGAMAPWAMMPLEHGMIGYYLCTGGANIMAPFGGYDRVLGNNPFAVAVPTGPEYPFPIVLDMACSVTARGWIVIAMHEGRPIPEGWALDEEGRPTTDARAAYEGSVLPLGGHKGYGLALIVGILSSLLTGGAIGEEVTDYYEEFERHQNVGHFLGAIDVAHFVPVDDFARRVDGLITFVKSSRTLPGCDKVYVPGEKEHEAAEVNGRLGIPVAPTTLQQLEDIAARYRVDWIL